MKNFKTYICASLVALTVWSCDEEDKLIESELAMNPDDNTETVTGESGSLDLSTYVALGASISAGAMDNALYTHGQNNSFPAILAQQFMVDGIDGGEFNQPDINSVNGYSGVGDDGSIEGKLVLDLDLNNDLVLGDAGIVTSAGELPTAYDGNKSTLNNFAVPGILTAQMLTPLTGDPTPGNPAYNALYARFASAPGSSTILEDAMDRIPTFFTLWPGGNDVLGYAASGGTGTPLTDPAQVSAQIDGLVSTLISGGAKGVILTVPNLTVLPYFQAVPRVISVPEASQTDLLAGIGQLNAAINGWNAGVNGNESLTDEQKAALVRPTLSENMLQYPLVIVDASLSDAQVPTADGPFTIPKIRNINATPHAVFGVSELILLPALPQVQSGLIGISPLTPLTDDLVLNFTEIAGVMTNLSAINQKIGSVALTNPGTIALMETFSFVTNIAVNGGYDVPGFKLAPDFSPNGIYSNDGIHINPRGCAILANEIINVLNKSAAEGGFGANIPTVDVLQYNASPFQQ